MLVSDIAHKALIGGNWSLSPLYIRANLRATALEGEIYVVKDPVTSRIVSFGLWFAPGKALFGSDEQKALGFNDFFNKLSTETQHWWTHTYPDTVRPFMARIWTKEELGKRLYCFNLCTDPEHQNRGYATAIVDFAFEKAKRNGQILGLSTSSDLNVRKYLSMGFRERGQTSLDAPTGGFPVHCFSRE
ncbi:hypothetical protein OE88DRAFT_1630635 [Heliocybe sulcata]|uniref:N-acetyltransferase domain-containing protein n=1 Tax=Heliocybe sulcata TaxID=5364 RepID=A0A5C3N1I8_9AGAM|nr:hypothetical protein OE88DRAFT_1630635 [Heliocybe sulcata]